MRCAKWTVGVLLVSGCAAFPGHSGTGSAAILVQAQVHAGSYQMQTQHIPGPYTAADVDHVVVSLFTLGANGSTASVEVGGVPLALTVPAASLSAPLNFGNLHENTSYEILGQAYSASLSTSSDLISLDSQSTVSVSVTDNNAPVLADLPIQLQGAPFSATATTTISIASGSYTTSGSELITVP